MNWASRAKAKASTFTKAKDGLQIEGEKLSNARWKELQTCRPDGEACWRRERFLASRGRMLAWLICRPMFRQAAAPTAMQTGNFAPRRSASASRSAISPPRVPCPPSRHAAAPRC